MTALALVAKRTTLSKDDWVSIIESRLELIIPRLDSVTFPNLDTVVLFNGPGALSGDQSIQSMEKGKTLRGITFEGDEAAMARLSRYMQGCFSYNRNSRETSTGEPGARYYAWGLSRSGRWVLIRQDHFYSNRDWRTTRGMDLHIKEASLDVLLEEGGVRPGEVCALLSRLMYMIEKRRKELLEEISKIADILRRDDNLLNLIGESGFSVPQSYLITKD